ncbi:class I adenylate-forming enzyme family protein, partial [Rhodococcus sp. C26F]
TLPETIRGVAARFPDRVAVQFEDVAVSYSEFFSSVDRAAVQLQQAGVTSGDRVAVLAGNSIETLVAHLAPTVLGAMTVPINTRLTADEIAYILDDCRPQVVCVDDRFEALAQEAGERSEHGARIRRVADPAASSEPVAPAPIAADDPAYIMYTSGTTGRPKGAVLTHRNLLGSIANSRRSRDINSPELVWFAGLPLFHIGGILGPLTHLTVGAKSILAGTGGFSGEEAVDLLEREGVSACFFVPTQWDDICAVPGVAERTPQLRQIIWGGAPASDQLLGKLRAAFPGAEIHSSFGQTETASATCVLDGHDFAAKRGAAGRPLPAMEVRIVDEEMNDVPVGEAGEIVYRGPTVMREYWNKPEATAEAFRGGWFHSGDVGTFDSDGYVWVLSRLNDMIISGGENVYPAEVEEAVLAHPAVAEVAVAGIPHERWGQVPVAFVVPTAPATGVDHEEIRAWCRERLAGYKVPASTVVVEELPRNAAGKILRRNLIEDALVGGSR